jgi:hypothetical protein
MRFVVSLLTILLFQTISSAQQLELSKIMAGNDFIGHQPEDIAWSPESNRIYFRWNTKVNW